MVDNVTTRIRLPGPVHREVKAEAARHGINLDEALGMVVARFVDIVKPLVWLDSEPVFKSYLAGWLDTGKGRLSD